MKKLIIAVAIVCAAALSQAAAIDWSTGNLVDHAGAVIKNSTAYTATVYFFSDAEGTTDISDSFGAVLSESQSTKKGEYANTITTPTAATGTYYTKVIITDGEWALASDIATFVYDAESISNISINFQSGDGLNKAVLNNTGADYGWTNVPEPTSGLLLLLGVAGLALRRRRA